MKKSFFLSIILLGLSVTTTYVRAHPEHNIHGLDYYIEPAGDNYKLHVVWHPVGYLGSSIGSQDERDTVVHGSNTSNCFSGGPAGLGFGANLSEYNVHVVKEGDATPLAQLSLDVGLNDNAVRGNLQPNDFVEYHRYHADSRGEAIRETMETREIRPGGGRIGISVSARMERHPPSGAVEREINEGSGRGLECEVKFFNRDGVARFSERLLDVPPSARRLRHGFKNASGICGPAAPDLNSPLDCVGDIQVASRRYVASSLAPISRSMGFGEISLPQSPGRIPVSLGSYNSVDNVPFMRWEDVPDRTIAEGFQLPNTNSFLGYTLTRSLISGAEEEDIFTNVIVPPHIIPGSNPIRYAFVDLNAKPNKNYSYQMSVRNVWGREFAVSTLVSVSALPKNPTVTISVPAPHTTAEETYAFGISRESSMSFPLAAVVTDEIMYAGDYTYLWTSSDARFIIAEPNALSTTVSFVGTLPASEIEPTFTLAASAVANLEVNGSASTVYQFGPIPTVTIAVPAPHTTAAVTYAFGTAPADYSEIPLVAVTTNEIVAVGAYNYQWTSSDTRFTIAEPTALVTSVSFAGPSPASAIEATFTLTASVAAKPHITASASTVYQLVPNPTVAIAAPAPHNIVATTYAFGIAPATTRHFPLVAVVTGDMEFAGPYRYQWTSTSSDAEFTFADSNSPVTSVPFTAPPSGTSVVVVATFTLTATAVANPQITASASTVYRITANMGIPTIIPDPPFPYTSTTTDNIYYIRTTHIGNYALRAIVENEVLALKPYQYEWTSSNDAYTIKPDAGLPANVFRGAIPPDTRKATLVSPVPVDRSFAQEEVLVTFTATATDPRISDRIVHTYRFHNSYLDTDDFGPVPYTFDLDGPLGPLGPREFPNSAIKVGWIAPAQSDENPTFGDDFTYELVVLDSLGSPINGPVIAEGTGITEFIIPISHPLITESTGHDSDFNFYERHTYGVFIKGFIEPITSPSTVDRARGREAARYSGTFALSALQFNFTDLAATYQMADDTHANERIEFTLTQPIHLSDRSYTLHGQSVDNPSSDPVIDRDFLLNELPREQLIDILDTNVLTYSLDLSALTGIYGKAYDWTMSVSNPLIISDPDDVFSSTVRFTTPLPTVTIDIPDTYETLLDSNIYHFRTNANLGTLDLSALINGDRNDDDYNYQWTANDPAFDLSSSNGVSVEVDFPSFGRDFAHKDVIFTVVATANSNTQISTTDSQTYRFHNYYLDVDAFEVVDYAFDLDGAGSLGPSDFAESAIKLSWIAPAAAFGDDFTYELVVTDPSGEVVRGLGPTLSTGTDITEFIIPISGLLVNDNAGDSGVNFYKFYNYRVFIKNYLEPIGNSDVEPGMAALARRGNFSPSPFDFTDLAATYQMAEGIRNDRIEFTLTQLRDLNDRSYVLSGQNANDPSDTVEITFLLNQLPRERLIDTLATGVLTYTVDLIDDDLTKLYDKAYVWTVSVSNPLRSSPQVAFSRTVNLQIPPLPPRDVTISLDAGNNLILSWTPAERVSADTIYQVQSIAPDDSP